MSFYWYDFETFGVDPFRDRPAQFAGLRTDEEFNPIGEPLVIYCQPADDVLPQPRACLVTGITPQLAAQEGLVEAEFIRQIHDEFSQPNSCVLGYNTLRFDDEVTRNTLYRNFYDPYAREWQNGNSRWDLIDLVRLARAVRPEGIEWPDHDDGQPSFRLEDLTAANGIEHTGAHDAMVDVHATIALARLVRQRQPRLFDYVFSHRDKRSAAAMLDLRVAKPVLHISAMYPASKGCVALVMPLLTDARNKNAIYVYDLSVDPAPLQALSAAQIRARLYTRSDDLPEGVSRIPIKAVHINKCPVLVPAKTLTPEVAQRLNIDVSACEQHYQRINSMAGLSAKLTQALAPEPWPENHDPDTMLYSGGFFGDADRDLMLEIRAAAPEHLAQRQWPFSDGRLAEMLFRYRARNYPNTLSAEEQAEWQAYRLQRMLDQDGGGSITLSHYFEEIKQLLEDTPEPKHRAVLADLQAYGEALQASLN